MTFVNRMNLKKFLAAALLVIAPCFSAHASCSDCPDQKHDLKFHATATVAGGPENTLSVTMVIPDVQVTSGSVPANTPATTSVGTIKIDAEKVYHATVTVATTSTAVGCGNYLKVNFDANVCGYIIESRVLTKTTSGAWGQWSEWKKSSSSSTAVELYSFAGNLYQLQAQIEVRLIKKSDGSNSGEGGNNGSGGGGGDSSASPPQLPDETQASPPGSNGAPSQTKPTGFQFQTEMGSAPDSSGYNTGSLSLSGPLSQSLADISKLELRNVFDAGMKVVKNGETLRQVTNLEKLADIQPITGGGVEIRFFNKGSFGSELVNGLYPINSGAQPFRTVTLVPVAAGNDHLGGIRVTSTGPDGAVTWKETLSTSSDGQAWREVLGNGTEVRNHASLFDYDSTTAQWRRIDLNEVFKNGVLVSKNQRTYLYQLKRDPQTSAVVDRAQFLAEEIVYDTANSSLVTTWEPDNQLGRAKSVTRPDGSWESYIYYNDVGQGEDSAWRGRVQEVRKPWNGQPATPAQATSTNSESTVTTYQFSDAGIIPMRQVTTRPVQGVAVKVSETSTIAGQGHSYGSILLDAGLSPAWVPQYGDVYYEARSEMASSSESLYSDKSYVYVGAHVATGVSSSETVDAPWIGRSMGSVDGEGNGSITGYERGTFNASSGTFTVNNTADGGKDVRSITVKLENNQIPGNLLATKEVGIEDERGKPLRKELWIKDGNGNWALATTATYEYPTLWADGSPKETLVKKDGRVISRRLEISESETVHWNEQGIETRTLRDVIGRTVSVTRVGSGSQPDQVTTYGYNGLTTSVTTTAGDLSRTHTTVSDLIGRTVSETDPSGAVTTTAYPSGGRETLTTLPGGLTRRVTRSIDRRAVSVTGSAVVSEYYAYAALANGNLATTRRTSASDSPRYSVTEEDWAGRTVKVTTPSPTGTGEVATESFYLYGTQTLDHTVSPAGTMVSYEDQGTRYSGLDIDGDLNLTPASTDRMATSWTNYALENGYWWEVSTRRTYDTNGSGSSYVESISKRCLYGNPNGLAAWTRTTLPTGGTIETQATIDRATKTLVQTEISSAATNPAISTNVNGLLVSQQGRDATTPAQREYNGFGQPIRETSPRGTITRKTYSADGELETSTDHAGKVTQYAYYPPNHVSAGKLATVTNPDGKTTTYAYSNLGQVTEEAGTAAYKVTYDYDTYGAKNKMWTWRDATYSDLTEWVYQAGTGLLTAKKDAAGMGATYTYNAAGKIATRTWARGVSATYTYNTLGTPDTVGDLTGIDYSDATPDVSLTNYDRLGRPGSITQAGIGAESLTYHAGKAAPNVRYYAANHSLLPGIGLRTLAPDAIGRPTGFNETADANVTTLRTVGYSYHATSGLFEKITDGSQNHTYAYHPNSSLISTIHSNAGSTAWFRESRYYDTPGRLIGIRSDRMNGTSVAAAISAHGYDYDALGRRTKNTFQDGSFWQYGYNDRSEVTSATRKTAAGVAIAPLGASYAYDGIGNRLSSTSAVLGDHNYTPNALNQYATITTGNSRTAIGRAPAAWSVQVAGVNASRAGEIFYRPLTASNATAPVWQDVVIQRDSGTPTMTRHFWYASQTFSPVHDDDGNLTNDGRWLYTWNAENRLIQMETTTQATAAGHPYTKLQFAYDWEGHRIARHVWQGGTQASPAFKSSHRWLYDGWNTITEFTAPSVASTALTRVNTFTWGLDLGDQDGIPRQRAGGVGGLLVQTAISSAMIERASYDGNGNIVAWTKSTATAPTSRREYDAFGNTVVSEGASPSAFGFSTKTQDNETALYYYGYRFYDPLTGRWLGRDPLGEEGGTNLYAFLSNDGGNKTDYLGNRKVVIEYNAFIPKNVGHAVAGVPVSVLNYHWFEEPGPSLNKKGVTSAAATDDRDAFGGSSVGSSRIHTRLEFDTSEVGSFGENKRPDVVVGESHRLKYTSSGYVAGSLESKRAAWKWTSGPSSSDPRPSTSTISWGVEASYPFNPVAPNIDLEIKMTICYNKKTDKLAIMADGEHNGFPAYEMMVNDGLVHSYKPTATGPGLYNLAVETITWGSSGTY
jgi:RHS repeat-associated protein